ncbi:MAG TPA: hypothetical protein VIV40_10055 [Kofleriaceae bacterium]
MKSIKLLGLAAVLLIGCGDNKSAPDARVKPDAPISFPSAPALGKQIDRMGRPAVNTALNHGFDDPSAAATQAAKTAYNEMTAKTDWLAPASIGQFAKNLAIIDVLDSGICGNGRCEIGESGANVGNTCAADCGADVTGGGCGDGFCNTGETGTTCAADCATGQTGSYVSNGCGNQAFYNNSVPGLPPNAMSYVALAAVLAHDELYIDTSKGNCDRYLAVEFGVFVLGASPLSCGGRGLEYDVMDYSYSMLSMGVLGFSTDGNFTPKVQDGAGPHTDYSATFPFLGAPHTP